MGHFLFTTLRLPAADLPQIAGAQESRGSGEVPTDRYVFAGIGT